MFENKRVKRPCCVPTHLTESEAVHVAKHAYERNWSNSAYIRELVRKDIQQKEDDLNLRASTEGVPREHYELFEPSERNERNKKPDR